MVHYTGFASDGSQFDCSLKRNKPLKFVVGQGKVISGLDEGPCVLLDFLCCRWREAETKDEGEGQINWEIVRDSKAKCRDMFVSFDIMMCCSCHKNEHRPESFSSDSRSQEFKVRWENGIQTSFSSGRRYRTRVGAVARFEAPTQHGINIFAYIFQFCILHSPLCSLHLHTTCGDI